MREQLRLQQIIQNRFDQARSRNPSLSLRAFCRRYNLSSAIVSLILLGKRRAGKKTLEQILTNLNFDPQERSAVLPSTTLSLQTVTPDYVQLSAEQYKVISEWYYMAILYLTHVQDFKSDSAWIAERIGITKSTAQNAIDRLFKLGHLVKNEKGNWILSKPNLRTTDDVQNSALRRSHDEVLELAKNSLHNDSLGRRDFTWLVLPMSSKKMERGKELIREFQDRFLSEMGNDPNEYDEVYRMAIQLFPHTQMKKPTLNKNKKGSI